MYIYIYIIYIHIHKYIYIEREGETVLLNTSDLFLGNLLKLIPRTK